MRASSLHASDPSVPASSLPTNPLLWHCDFEQSTRADVARGNPDPLDLSGVIFVPDHRGLALRLDTGFVEYAAAQHMSSAEGTLAGWVSLDPTQPNRGLRTLFTWGEPSGDSFAVTFSADAREVRALIRPRVRAASSLATGNIDPQPNTWNHLAVTWSYPRLCIFWNGEPVADAELRSVVGRPAARFRLGARPAQTASPFLALDDFRLYDRALNERELSVLTGLYPRPRLVRADLLQRDYQHPARVIPWAAQLRGELTDRHQLRLEVPGQPPLTVPWADAPVFVLDQPLPVGTNTLSLTLLEAGAVLDRVTDETVCLPSFSRP
ncbi:MAG: LamG domain-containing protein [Verrucomicrobia bacterium]|nr:LamG domain-containing protein [Verrucomicrobiota bacterium]